MSENILMPRVGGYDVQEAVLVRWLKREGDAVSAGEPVAEVESDKATIELPSPHTGTIARILVAEGASVSVGTALATVMACGENPVDGAREDKTVAAPADPGAGGRVKVSPVARKLADEWQLDLTRIRGTGPDGRITREDVERAREGLTSAPPATDGQAAPAADQPLSKMRRVIAERMTLSATTVPHFTVVSEIDMDAALALREQLNSSVGAGGVSITDLLVRAAALALRRFPILNASFAGDRLVRHPDINIGLAVTLQDGLVTPVLYRADVLPLLELSRRSAALVERARGGHLQMDDLGAATFTISNLGMFDVAHFIPIINPPEAAILAVGTVRATAAVVSGTIQVRQRLNAALAVDHRVTDGATAAQFLQELKAYLQAPARLLI